MRYFSFFLLLLLGSCDMHELAYIHEEGEYMKLHYFPDSDDEVRNRFLQYYSTNDLDSCLMLVHFGVARSYGLYAFFELPEMFILSEKPIFKRYFKDYLADVLKEKEVEDPYLHLELTKIMMLEEEVSFRYNLSFAHQIFKEVKDSTYFTPRFYNRQKIYALLDTAGHPTIAKVGKRVIHTPFMVCLNSPYNDIKRFKKIILESELQDSFKAIFKESIKQDARLDSLIRRNSMINKEKF